MNLGRILIVTGVIILLVGLAIVLFEEKLKWFGSMPFDLNYKNKSMHIFAPFGSMIIISAVLTIVLNLILKLFK